MLLRKKQEIEAWLNQYDIKNYELIPNEEYGYVVNVNRYVDLFNRNLNSIEIKFNKINGYFNCNNNNLKTLRGCPEIVIDEFFAYSNQLQIEGLKYLPKEINSNYINIFKNKELGNLEYINNFLELQETIRNLLEKENLLNILNKEVLKKEKISINKI